MMTMTMSEPSLSHCAGKAGQGGIVAERFVIHGSRSTRTRVIWIPVILRRERSGIELSYYSETPTALVIPADGESFLNSYSKKR